MLLSAFFSSSSPSVTATVDCARVVVSSTVCISSSVGLSTITYSSSALSSLFSAVMEGSCDVA